MRMFLLAEGQAYFVKCKVDVKQQQGPLTRRQWWPLVVYTFTKTTYEICPCFVKVSMLC